MHWLFSPWLPNWLELRLSASAQHHTGMSYCKSLAQEKLKIQNTVSTECVSLLQHRLVKPSQVRDHLYMNTTYILSPLSHYTLPSHYSEPTTDCKCACQDYKWTQLVSSKNSSFFLTDQLNTQCCLSPLPFHLLSLASWSTRSTVC